MTYTAESAAAALSANTREQLESNIHAAAEAALTAGSSASKLYLRVRPDGTVDTTEETSWCCSPDEYYKRVPHTLSLEILPSTRDYSSLSDDEIEACADNASEAADELVAGWESEISAWVEAGNLKAAVTIESIAAETGWPIVKGCLVPEPGTWYADDGNAEIEVECDSGEEAAQEYVDGGDWGEITETTWIKVWAWREGIDEDGDICRVDKDRHTITLEPPEPECENGQEHDWQSPLEFVGGLKENPGVYGHDGGVTIQEGCIHCGCGKLTDTWAQDMSDGEQGLLSVSYEPGKYQIPDLCTNCGKEPAEQACQDCDKHVCSNCRESELWSTDPGKCAECAAADKDKDA